VGPQGLFRPVSFSVITTHPVILPFIRQPWGCLVVEISYNSGGPKEELRYTVSFPRVGGNLLIALERQVCSASSVGGCLLIQAGTGIIPSRR
jgi:hypothetical protein